MAKLLKGLIVVMILKRMNMKRLLLLLLPFIALNVAAQSKKDKKNAKNDKIDTIPANAHTIEADEKQVDTKGKEVKWLNWNEGYTQAAKDNKTMLVDVYTSWCGWCKRMDHDTYTN